MKKKGGKYGQYSIKEYFAGDKYSGVLKQLGTVRASNYIYLNPLVTMVASVIILHEKITWITLLGAGCIIFGVYQAEKK